MSAPAFSRRAALALVAGGAALFVALLWLIGSGAPLGGDANDGGAHAGGKGLNGYAALARMLEADGYSVTRSRSGAGLDTGDLLILTPPAFADPQAIAAILKKREGLGPTLVILPKWSTMAPSPTIPAEAREKFRPGWVILTGADRIEWSAALPAPYGFTHQKHADPAGRKARWEGLSRRGATPTGLVLHASPDAVHRPLVRDGAGRVLAMLVEGAEESDYRANAHWTVFVADADLLNNYGMADPARAALAAALVREAAYDGEIAAVTFDLTLNGFGASENLLTLAFRPPFLAATLCLLIALLVVGWRAFLRFGPVEAGAAPEVGMSKRRLIANGAGLILRARRFRLLARPYAALSARRMAERLGLPHADPAAIDAALSRRLPDAEPFARRIARLDAATKPADILAAARSLDALADQLSQGTPAR